MRPPRQYRSLGLVLDRDDFGLELTLALWWREWQWTWHRKRNRGLR